MKNPFSRLLTLLLIIIPFIASAQGGITKEYKVVTTAVPFLGVSPDSKAASLGDAGVASEADANSIFWNTSKLAFSKDKYGSSFSYAPWLRDLVNDMGLLTLAGYYKLNDKQAITGGLTYFNQGLIEFTTNTGEKAGDFQSREAVFAAGIAQKLSSDFSMSLNFKYITSNLVGTAAINNQAGKPGRTAAFDLGFYYNKNRPTDLNAQFEKSTDIAYGAVIQNLGGKVNYGFGQYFIPANLKIGTKIAHKPDMHNTFTLLLDFNKLLVPTPQPDGSEATKDVFPSILSSFTDAPGGFREELSEIMTSVGLEYSYDNLMALRAGYFYEANSKGGRQYITTGFGISLKEIAIVDLAYLVPTKVGSPLANTWRVTINFLMPAKKINNPSDNEE